MRIAFIVRRFPALSETFVLNQVTGLLDRGHEVDIYPARLTEVTRVHPDVERYRLSERTHQPPRIERSWVARALKGIALFLTNVHVAPLTLLRTLNVFKHGRLAASLVPLHEAIPHLGKEPYDIVHCHFGDRGSMGVVLRDMGALKGRVVTTFHGADMSEWIRLKGDDAYRRLFQSGDLFLPISERWRRRLVEMGCDERRTRVHRMGIDSGRFQFAPRSVPDDGRVRILTIARLVEKKGVEYGIRAVARLAEDGKQVEHHVVGDGELREELQQLIDSLGVGDVVSLLGSKSQDEVIEIMRRAHLFLAPSVTAASGDQEGIPVALMEAMAMGLPVVSTHHSGIPELVQDGLTGFLVPERDVDALAEKLADLLDHPEAWPEMGQAGRSFVEKHFDIDVLNDRLVSLFEEQLAGSTAEG